MIIHKLIKRHITHGDDDEFYRLQASDALRWINMHRPIRKQDDVLDLACGCGVFGDELRRMIGCKVLFSDHHPSLRDYLVPGSDFRVLSIGNDPIASLGQFDLVLTSNILEHLPDGPAFIREAHTALKPGGVMYLSWTNWFSPWGGHDFSPWHYLGTKLGPAIYDLIHGKGKRGHFPYAGLWPTHIGRTIKLIKANPHLRIVAMAPRYYTEMSWLMKVPVLREFLSWNCAILIQRTDTQ